MRRITAWIYGLLTAALLLFAALRYREVKLSLISAEDRLTRLRADAAQLEKENRDLILRIEDAIPVFGGDETAGEADPVVRTDSLYWADNAD